MNQRFYITIFLVIYWDNIRDYKSKQEFKTFIYTKYEILKYI